MYQHIVIAVDGSRTSQHALKQACGLAKATGAALTLVHVANPAEYVATVAPEFLQYENYEAAATKSLVEYATEQKADLLVLGTHGRTGLMHLLMGSFAETVMRETRLPLLIIRREA